MLNRKNRLDPNAPQFNRIPLPEMYDLLIAFYFLDLYKINFSFYLLNRRDVDRANRQQAMRDFLKRARLSSEKLPSICFYTILNSHYL